LIGISYIKSGSRKLEGLTLGAEAGFSILFDQYIIDLGIIFRGWGIPTETTQTGINIKMGIGLNL
jgi:hypothetical protein